MRATSTAPTSCCGLSIRQTWRRLRPGSWSTLADVAEEIEDVGRTQLRTVELLLVQALRHMKAEGCGGFPSCAELAGRCDPFPPADPGPIRAIHAAGDRCDQSLRRRACRLPETMDGQPPLPIQTEMPTLDELPSDLD